MGGPYILGPMAYILFQLDNSTNWIGLQDLSPPNNEKDFGRSVSIDGNYCIVGAPGFSSPGSAIVFQKSGSSWSFFEDFSETEDFGYSVAIENGHYLIGHLGDSEYGSITLVKHQEFCPEQLSKNAIPNNPGIYQALQTITGTGHVKNGFDVEYSAPTIILNGGFQVANGTIFETNNLGCN